MNLGNMLIHPQAQFNISKPTLAFIQMPQQTVNSGQNSVAVCQNTFNIPSSTLCKRSNPYDGLDSVEKKLKVPEAAVLVQVVPQNALHHPHSPPMVSFQGFEQFLAPKPQDYQQIQSWRPLENINTGGFLQIAPQNVPMQVYQQQVGGQPHQFIGNPMIISNAPNQFGNLHVQAPAPFQMVPPQTSQAYVVAGQANWNFTGNYIGHQNMQILNTNNSNFGFQQIQNVQAVVVSPNAIFQNSNTMGPLMNTGSFHQNNEIKNVKKAPREEKLQSKIQQKKSIELKLKKSEKDQEKKMQEESPKQKQVQEVKVQDKKEDVSCSSAFLNKRKNWKRVGLAQFECKNRLQAELSQVIPKAEVERKNIVLTSAEFENEAKTLPFFENKPVGKKMSFDSKDSPISVDSEESTTLGDDKTSPSPRQDETACS